MKKIMTALTLFSKKMPNIEIQAIENTFQNWFLVTTGTGDKYVVDIGRNSVETYYPDP